MPEMLLKRWQKQEPRLVDAVTKIAERVAGCPPNKKFKNTPPRALLVGGCVRDLMLDLKPKDADVEIFGVTPDEVERLTVELFGKHVDAVGKSFGVLKVFLGDGYEIDVTLPRRESKAGWGHRGFKIASDPGLSLEDAARRRDFTFNAISLDPLTGELIDPFNGQDDLKDRLLRVVDAKHFPEDPLRVYRAVQFAARFNGEIDPASFKLMRKMVERGDLEELSKERVGGEIKKLLLKAPKPSVGFELARELDVIGKYYPELAIMKQTPQEPDWHPEGDVWIHTLMVVDEAAKIIRRDEKIFNEEEKLQLMLGALCHDLGKPSTTAPGEKKGIPRIRSLGHEAAGGIPTQTLLDKWAFGERAEHAAVTIATEHMHPLNFYFMLQRGVITEEQYANTVRKLIRRIQPLNWRVFLAACEADHRGRGFEGLDTDPYEIGKTFAAAVKKHELDIEAKKTLVQGRDILDLAAKLGVDVKPGPQFGELISQIEALRDEGTIKTREEGLEKLKELLGQCE